MRRMRRRDGRLPFGTGCIAALALLAMGVPATADEGPQVVVRAAWGAEDGQLGRRGGQESAPEGPMSFVVAPSGEIDVLDQVNRRIVRFAADGGVRGSIPLGSDTFQDLALAPCGQLVLLDRLAAQLVRVLDAEGTVLGEAPLVGTGIAEGGGTTALFARDDGVWVEYDHRSTVRVLDAQFREPFYRDAVLGRPFGGGRLGRARLAGPSSVEVWTVERAANVIRAEATLSFDEPVSRIAALAEDVQGETFLAVHLRTEDPTTFATVHSALVGLVLDGALVERRRIVTTPSVGAWEQFKEFEFSADGTVWQLAFVEEGVEVRRWLP